METVFDKLATRLHVSSFKFEVPTEFSYTDRDKTRAKFHL